MVVELINGILATTIQRESSMRRKLMGLAVTALLISASARPAAAQARGYFGFGGGLNLPLGSFKDEAKLGWLGQVLGGVTTKGGMWGGRVDGMYARHTLKGITPGHDALLGVNADVVVTPGKSAAKARPYFLAGVGVYNGKTTFTTGTNPPSSTKFAFNGGLGLNIHTSKQMGVYIEGRYVNVQTEGGSTSFIPFSVGLRWGGY
jgi:opacity protein-like surface antigen